MLPNISINMDIDPRHLPLNVQQPFGILFSNGFGGQRSDLVWPFGDETQVHQVGVAQVGFPVVQEVVEVVGEADAQFFEFAWKKKEIRFQMQ